jgi:hypothetical protein
MFFKVFAKGNGHVWMHSTLCEPTLDLQNAPKPLAAGASPRTPLGELTALPQTP